MIKANASENGIHDQDEKLRCLGAHLTRVAHELRAPVSLIAGSLENLDLHLHALLRLVAVAKVSARHDQDLAQAYDETAADYAAANTSELLAICDEGLRRVSYVVEQLGRFAKPMATVPTAIDIEELLQRAAMIASSNRRRSPAIDWDVAGLDPFEGDAQALLQVFVNVIGNAFDAVGERDDGRVRVTAVYAAARAAMEVRVSDNGPGVLPADTERIFEPFFTTKSAGGLGLGLAIVSESLAAQGGTIRIALDRAAGAEFVITVPLARGRAAAMTEAPL